MAVTVPRSCPSADWTAWVAAVTWASRPERAAVARALAASLREVAAASRDLWVKIDGRRSATICASRLSSIAAAAVRWAPSTTTASP